MAYRTTIKAMYESLAKKELTMQDVSLIMSEVRKLLDENPYWKEEFRLLHFYCDWCQHDQVDRSAGCVRIIEEINRCLWQLSNDGVHDDKRSMDVSGFLRIPQLLQELEYVLSSFYAQRIVPTYTFVFSLFQYLIDIPVIPVDAENGRLAHNTKEYQHLCEKLHVGSNRPLIKNFVVTEVGDFTICYDCDMDGVETHLKGIIEFSYCTNLPFEISPRVSSSETIDPWNERWMEVVHLLQSGATQDAYRLLLQLHHDLESVPGYDDLRNALNQHCFEIGWSLTGKEEVFRYGEMAAETTTDSRVICRMYHDLSLYSLQLGLLEKADEYLKANIENARSVNDKATAYQMRGRIRFVRGEYDDALNSYATAEKYAEQAHLEKFKVYIIINEADVLCAKGLNQTAIGELNRAKQIAKDCHDLVLFMRCMVRTTQVYYSIGQDEDAKQIIAQIPQQFD